MEFSGDLFARWDFGLFNILFRVASCGVDWKMERYHCDWVCHLWNAMALLIHQVLWWSIELQCSVDEMVLLPHQYFWWLWSIGFPKHRGRRRQICTTQHTAKQQPRGTVNQTTENSGLSCARLVGGLGGTLEAFTPVYNCTSGFGVL